MILMRINKPLSLDILAEASGVRKQESKILEIMAAEAAFGLTVIAALW